MALTQAEVDEFMAADKVVRGSAPMVWSKPEQSRYLYRAPVDVEAARVGGLWLWSNPMINRSWFFKLIFQGEDVYRWDVRPLASGHDNPPGRPGGYPKRVPEPEHEHVWHEGMDLKCALPLRGLETSGHREIFEAFCDRTHVRFDPEYVAPQAYEQIPFPL